METSKTQLAILRALASAGANGGKPTPEAIKDLTDNGIPQSIVDDYIQVVQIHQAVLTANAQPATPAVTKDPLKEFHGQFKPDQLQAIFKKDGKGQSWLDKAYTPAEIAAFELQVFNGADEGRSALAKSILSRFEGSQPLMGNTNGSTNTNAAKTEPYKDRKEFLSDFTDPRMNTDPNFANSVAARKSISDFGT